MGCGGTRSWCKPGPLYAVQEHVWHLVNPWQSESSTHSQKLSACVDHIEALAGESFDKHECIHLFSSSALSVGAAVWSRLQLKYWNLPWMLLRGEEQASS